MGRPLETLRAEYRAIRDACSLNAAQFEDLVREKLKDSAVPHTNLYTGRKVYSRNGTLQMTHSGEGGSPSPSEWVVAAKAVRALDKPSTKE